jgi:hypothetical protein
MRKIITLSLFFMGVLASCVQEEHMKNVTFKVDTNGLENIESLGIRGSFLPNQWRESFPLTDDDIDGIYEVNFKETTAVNSITFKFVKNGFDYELKNSENRQITFEYKPETLIYQTKFNDTLAIITKK